MANRDEVRGFRYIGSLSHVGPPIVKTMMVASSYNTAVAVGDLVKLTGTSSTHNITGTGAYPTVQQAAKTDNASIAGVIVGIEPNYDNLTRTYIPASTGGVVYVCVDPDALYMVQEDSDTSNIALTDVGENIDIINAGVNTTTGTSGFEIDSSDAGTGDNFRIVGLWDSPDNAIGANAKWVVQINEQAFKTTAGV